MQSIKNQELLMQFELRWMAQVQTLTAIRRTKMSQNTIASLIGTNTKAIQRFENYKSRNPQIMFAYKTLLKSVK